MLTISIAIPVIWRRSLDFSAHFGQLSITFLWLSGMYFHGARFSNYEAWLSDPTHIGPSAQVVWPIVGQEILNGGVGGGFRGIQITSGFFQIWRASRITSLSRKTIGREFQSGMRAHSKRFHTQQPAASFYDCLFTRFD